VLFDGKNEIQQPLAADLVERSFLLKGEAKVEWFRSPLKCSAAEPQPNTNAHHDF
jgi:hypothetical protein